MLVNTLCYKTKKGNGFLFRLGMVNDAAAAKQIDDLNALLPSNEVYDGLNLADVERFYLGEKEEI